MITRATNPVYGGYTISRTKEGVFFIQGAIPDEIVEVKPVSKKSHYSFATVKKVIEPSPDRINPECPEFNRCGGCHYQFITYSRQVLIKEEIIKDSLKRIAKIETDMLPAITGSEWHYRMRARMKINHNGKLSFFSTASHTPVTIKVCPVLFPKINNFISKVTFESFPDKISQMEIQVGEKGPEETVIHIPKIHYSDTEIKEIIKKTGNVLISTEEEKRESRPKLYFELCGLDFSVSSGVFFQSNWPLNKKLVMEVVDFVKKTSASKIIDLYAGSGNFSLPLAFVCKKVIAVEENKIACMDGKDNAIKNHFGNIEFFNCDVESFDIPENAELIVVDPPREGMSKKVVEKILNSKANFIIYVSCNPSTFARDIKRLCLVFSLLKVRLVDMFPQTFHIELLGILSRKM